MRIVLAFLSCAIVATAQQRGRPVPTACVVADGERAAALDAALRDANLPRQRVAIADCTPEALRCADVVVVDWPEGAPFGERPPLGDFARWDRPTVFVGRSGERFARAWRLPTAAEMVALPPKRRGVEMQHFAPVDGGVTGVERQGHLFHFACAAAPTDWEPAERAWFTTLVREAATFVTDRPIVRQPMADGGALSADELARRARIDRAAEALRCDVRRLPELTKLGRMALTGDQQLVEQLCGDLLRPVGAGPLPNEWGAWLRSHDDELAWDELSFVWRQDPLATARGRWSRVLVGEKRADGAWRDAEVTALVDAVARRHGARAFADLSSFRCRLRDLVYTWDLRGGWFRMENHGATPRGVPPWNCVVLDTTTGRCVRLGDQDPELPDERACHAFQELVAHVFLPVLLLRPGTTVQRAPAERDDGAAKALRVRFAHSGIDPRFTCEVCVAADGALTALRWRIEPPHPRDDSGWATAASVQATATQPCGPMTLPVAWTGDDASGYSVADCEWNPELPPDLVTAVDRLTEPPRPR